VEEVEITMSITAVGGTVVKTGDSVKLELAPATLTGVEWSVSNQDLAYIAGNNQGATIEVLGIEGTIIVRAALGENVATINLVIYVETTNFIFEIPFFIQPSSSLVLREQSIARIPSNATASRDILSFELDANSEDKASLAFVGSNLRLTVFASTNIGEVICVWVRVTTWEGNVIEKQALIMVNTIAYNPDIPVEQIKIICFENTLPQGEMSEISVRSYPTGADATVFWASSDTTVARIEGVWIIALKPGEVIITATSVDKTNGEITDQYIITIIDPVNFEPRADLGGYIIYGAEAEGNLFAYDPTHPDYEGSDKMYLLVAYESVGSLYNCEFKWKPYIAAWGPPRNNETINNANAGTAYWDIGVYSSMYIHDLAKGNALLPTTDYYEQYGFSQMPAIYRQETTTGGQLYGVQRVNAISKVLVEMGIIYNVNLLKMRGIESPAKLFNEDRWTVSEFVQWVADAQAALQSGEYVIAGQPYYWWQGIIGAASMALCDPVTVSINIIPEEDGTNTYPKYIALELNKLYTQGYWSPAIGWDNNCADFNQGRAIAQAASYWYINAANRFYPTMWGEETAYGWAPFPYPDAPEGETSKKDMTRQTVTSRSVWIMSAGKAYPSGVSGLSVYQAWSEMIYVTGKSMREDINYDFFENLRDQAKLNVAEDDSVDAICFFYNSSKLIFDPLSTIIENNLISRMGSTLNKIVVSGNDYDAEMATQYPLYLADAIARFG